MSGVEVVRAFRSRLNTVDHGSSSALRKPVIVASVAASLIGFGTLVVRAGDDASVYEINRQYNRAREVVRSVPLPSIFIPQQRSQPVMRTALSYAPVFDSLMPSASTGKRVLDDKSGNTASHSASNGQTRKKAKAKADEDFAKAYIEQRTSYCVRSCDGFFFPVGNPDSGELAAHEASCQRACPGSETAVYVAPAGSKGIEDAVNRKGQRYELMQSAFNHRSQIDNACSCASNQGAQQRNYSVMNDFTLRKGDLVMSREGLKVFNGTERFPYRTADFIRPDGVRMSASDRQTIQRLEAATMRGMSGARLSPTLKARISAQVEGASAPGRTGQATAQATRIARQITVQDGRQMRYVGPDSDFDRAR